MSALSDAAREVLRAAGYAPCGDDLGHWTRDGVRYTAPDALLEIAERARKMRAYLGDDTAKVEAIRALLGEEGR